MRWKMSEHGIRERERGKNCISSDSREMIRDE